MYVSMDPKEVTFYVSQRLMVLQTMQNKTSMRIPSQDKSQST